MPSFKDRVRNLLKRGKGGQRPLSTAQPPAPAASSPAAAAPAAAPAPPTADTPKAAPAETPATTAPASTPAASAPAAEPTSTQPSAPQQEQIPILAEPISRNRQLLPQVKVAATTSGTLQIALQNQSNTDQIWAYISKLSTWTCLSRDIAAAC